MSKYFYFRKSIDLRLFAEIMKLKLDPGDFWSLRNVLLIAQALAGFITVVYFRTQTWFRVSIISLEKTTTLNMNVVEKNS